MKRIRMSRLGLVLAVVALLIVVAACAQQPAAPAPAPAQQAATAPTTAPAGQAAAPTTAAAPAGQSAAPTAAAKTTAPTAAPQAAAPTAAAVAAAPGQGRGKGETLKILYWQAPTILNSHLAVGTKDFHAASVVLEPLAWFGPDGKPVAALAADVPTRDNGGVSADGKTVTWKLKQGVKWSDGTPFTADDVLFTYQYISDPKTASVNARYAANVDKVEAPDQYTIKVTFKNSTPDPYQFLVGQNQHIIQKKQFQDYMGEKAKDAPGNLKPIGTGPYKVDDFKPGDVVIYSINENYRDPSKPFFKQVQIKGGGDATSAARAVFQTGEADYAWNLQVPWAAMQPMVQGGKGEPVTLPSSQVERLNINFADPNKEVDGARSEPSTKHPFLTDIKVRQALKLAVDPNQIATQLYGAYGQGTCNQLNAPPEYVSKNTTCKQDFDQANKLLDEAGWKMGADGIREKDGVKLKVLYQTTVNPVRQATQDLIKAWWRKIGVDTELKAINSSVFFDSAPGNTDNSAHFYADIEMYTNGTDQPDPTNYFANWTTKEIAQKSNEWRGQNYHRWSNPDYDKLVDQLRTELDPAKRKDLIIKLNDMLVNEVVVIPLVSRATPASGKAKDLKGNAPNPWDSELWDIANWYR